MHVHVGVVSISEHRLIMKVGVKQMHKAIIYNLLVRRALTEAKYSFEQLVSKYHHDACLNIGRR